MVDDKAQTQEVHWPDCWRVHHGCLLARYNEQANRLRTLQWRLDDCQRRQAQAEEERDAALAQVVELRRRLAMLDAEG